MLLVAPLSGLAVKINRFSWDPAIAYIHQHLFKKYYFQIEQCYDASQNIHTPYQSLRKFPRLYRTAGLVDWKNLPDQPGFHQTDNIWEQTTKKKKYKFLSLNVK